MMKKVVVLIWALCSFDLWSTTFVPNKIIERMKNTDGAVLGTFVGSSYKKIATGDVVTEHQFRLDLVSGLSPNEIISKDSFKVIVPGGKWNKLVYKVSGTPTFKKGEKVVLMVKKGAFGYVLPDLALSKFTVKTKGARRLLVSEIFPNTDGVGKISLSDFSMLASNVYGEELKKYQSDRFVHKPKKVKARGAHRSLASVDDFGASEKGESNNNWSYVWLIFGLGLVGGAAKWLTRGTSS